MVDFSHIKPNCKHLKQVNYCSNYCELLGAKCIKERFFSDDYCKLEDRTWSEPPPMPKCKDPREE